MRVNEDFTYEELIMLDGKCSDSIQSIVDEAKYEKSVGLPFEIQNRMVRLAVESGELRVRNKKISNCRICNKSKGYVKFKSRPRKGKNNYDKPLYLQGYEINPGFVSITGYGHFCVMCNEEHEIIKTVCEYIDKHNLPVDIYTSDYKNNKKKDPQKECFKCRKTFYESEAGMVQALFIGHYHGKCPHCGAEETEFGSSHKSTGEFRVI